MTDETKFKAALSSPRMRKIFSWVLISLLVFAIVGFFVLPPVIKYLLTRELSEKLHRPTTISQIKVNPFAFSVTVKGFRMKDRNGLDVFVSFDELYLNLLSLSIVKGAPILGELKLNNPYVRIVRNDDGSYNFSDLLESKPKKESKMTKFSLNNIQLLNGSIDFIDGPKHTAHYLRDMNIRIPTVSSLPSNVDIFVKPSFEAKVNGTPVSFGGETKPFEDTHETHLDVNMQDLDIPYYMEYSPFKLPFRVSSGLLDLNIRLSFIQYKDKAPSFNVSGKIALKKIGIDDLEENTLVSVGRLDISMSPSELFAKKIHLANVTVQSPEMDVSRDKNGKINLMALLPEPEPGTKSADKETTPLSFDADHIKVADGTMDFSDFQSIPFKTTVEIIDVAIDNLSTTPGKKAKARLSCRTESDEKADLESDFSMNPPASDGTLKFSRIQLKKYAPYYSQMVLFDFEDGAFDFSTKYSIKKAGDEFAVNLSDLSAALSSLKLRQRGEKDDFLDIPKVSISKTSVDLAKKEVNIGELSSQNGVLKINRYKDGKINVLGLMPESKTPAVKPKKTEKAQEMLITLKDASVDDYKVQVEDAVPQEPVKLVAEKIKFKGTDLSTVKNSKGTVSLSLVLNKRGSFSTDGSVSINPPSSKMKLNVKGIEIAPFQPYFTDRVRIVITHGNISLNGTVAAGFLKNGEMKASFNGNAFIRNFASLDKANAEDFLKWGSLYFGGIKVSNNPVNVNIDQVALNDFYSRIVIQKDGSINLQGVMQKKGETGAAATETEEKETETGEPAAEPAKPVEAPPKEIQGSQVQKPSETGQAKPAAVANPAGATTQTPAKMVKIAAVTLQGGTINFSDKHIQPNFSSSFLEMGGKISGLSSEENKPADVELRGKLENYAPLEITGKINPLSNDLYVNLTINFKNMDLSPLTPYSGLYLGYKVQEGDLSLYLQYLIVKNKLDSKNVIVLDQFTLGDPVESPKATKLPVKLAIALLKDRQGNINLDIPVSGYINDPKFSIGKIILKILVNLLVKAATSPFALLGAIFGGGGEQLSYVEFDYGRHDLDAQNDKKLDNLEKALYDRPALKLEIEGHVDLEKDKEGLKQYLLERKIKVQKLKDISKKGQPEVPLDQVTVGSDEYAKYLKMAYKAEKFPKPRNLIGFAKDLPVPEMEKLMITHIEVTDDDMRQLAAERALGVKDYVLKSGRITADRVFLVEPKSLEPEKKEKLKDSRVDFKLR
jgi:hypothetical protein